MRITTGNTTVDFSVTPNGMYTRKTTTPMGTVMKSTPSVQKFLSMMLEPVLIDQCREERLSICANWWEASMPLKSTGSFNREHYYKVYAAKLGLRKPVVKRSVINQFKMRLQCFIQGIL